MGAELRLGESYINNNALRDTGLTARVRWGFFSGAVGYRWFSTGGSSLDGVMVGASFHY